MRLPPTLDLQRFQDGANDFITMVRADAQIAWETFAERSGDAMGNMRTVGCSVGNFLLTKAADGIDEGVRIAQDVRNWASGLLGGADDASQDVSRETQGGDIAASASPEPSPGITPSPCRTPPPRLPQRRTLRGRAGASRRFRAFADSGGTARRRGSRGEPDARRIRRRLPHADGPARVLLPPTRPTHPTSNLKPRRVGDAKCRRGDNAPACARRGAGPRQWRRGRRRTQTGRGIYGLSHQWRKLVSHH